MSNHSPIFKQKGQDVEINGVTLTFYPTRLSMVLKLRKLSEDLVDGIMGLMTKDPTHYAGKTFKDGHTTINDVSSDKIEEYRKAKSAGMHSLVSTLMEEKNMSLLCELICDSLRDENYTAKDLMEMSDAETFMALASAMVGANSSILDPIMGKIQEAAATDLEGPETESE